MILRVRMRRGLLNRIHRIVDWDRERTQGTWNLSDAVREVLLPWVDRREAEIRAIQAAGPFTGDPPPLAAGTEDEALGVRPG